MRSQMKVGKSSQPGFYKSPKSSRHRGLRDIEELLGDP